MRHLLKRLPLFLLASLALAGGCGDVDETCSTTFGLSAKVEQWRKLVEKHFKYQHVTWALNIIKCESGGDPNAYNSSSGASGLFQHLKKYWADRAAKAGFPGASPFNPEANIAASAYLLYAPGGGKSHWVCKHSPFEDFNYQPQFYKDGNPVGGSTQPPPPPPPPPATCAMLPQSGGILDDGGPCFEMFGPEKYWRTVNGEGHGGSLHWTNATQQSTPANWARWQIQLSSPGKYEVQYFAVPTYAVFTATRYVIRHAGQEQTLIVNQAQGGPGWRTLGTFDFAQGGGQHVAIHDNTPQPVPKDQHIIADAIRLVPAGNTNDPPPPTKPPPKADGADGGVEPPPGGSRFDGGIEPPPPPSQPPDPVPPSGSPTAPRPKDGLQAGCSVGGGGPGAPLSLLPALVLLALLRRRS